MPTVVRPAEESALTQGDILRDVPLVFTGVDGKANIDTKTRFALVLSRPCKALRDEQVVVAPIRLHSLDLANLVEHEPPSLERARRAFASLRDGIRSGELSDSIYLGALGENNNHRFMAELNTLFTISVPAPNSNAGSDRTNWIKKHRVWRLHESFIRDLHTRLVLTFTRLGFEDHEWMADADLDCLINTGQREVAYLQTKLLSAEQAVQQKEALGAEPPAPMRTAIEAQRKSLADAEGRLRPYLEERARRKTRP